ncbi:hypothetical protein DTO57_10430 [Microbacterium sorbitolivorans]|uniref:Uncharacterized protein n=1 Tax=Microbacterium sorbitolivorans TaxID=1867410 RepID=A0A367XY65_9MICO|nr:hypothetical protein DTO57_10430 [Microbacterium sorbitolivorans]
MASHSELMAVEDSPISMRGSPVRGAKAATAAPAPSPKSAEATICSGFAVPMDIRWAVMRL